MLCGLGRLRFVSTSRFFALQWNNKGYDRAVKFAHKFTHISPVWLQAHTNKEASRYVIKGTHDIDAGK